MGSFQDFQTGMICSDHGWWNPKRSGLFPPCAAPLSDFTWTSSTLTSMDNQADQIQQQLVDASYSRSDDSDDHQSSSVEHLPVINSDYVQTFQDVQKPQLDDFGVSDWLHNSLWNDPAFSQDFFNQFDTTNEASRMTLRSSYPEELQNQVEPGSVTNYIFDNNFVASGGTTLDHWSRSLSSKINHGSNPSNEKNHLAPFWDSWMSNEEIGAPESHQLLVPASFEDQKPYKKDTSYKLHDTTTGTKRKITNDEVYKRPRIETPSSLPTFKVRKEKLGDRITALQQLVSPFGKTDTASVLHEAVEYIKFLHDQVSVLRTPYMQNGTTTNQHQQMQGESEDTKEGLSKDLRSRGLCLVPISSTFPVANETTSDFWTPSFGGTMAFR